MRNWGISLVSFTWPESLTPELWNNKITEIIIVIVVSGKQMWLRFWVNKLPQKNHISATFHISFEEVKGHWLKEDFIAAAI